MFGSIGGPEIILIFIVALLVFGPRKLPEIGRKVGRVIGEVRRATGELRANVEREIGFDPVTGLEQAGRARREVIASISDPIRDAAKGTISAAREVTALAALRPSPGPVTGEAPARTAGYDGGEGAAADGERNGAARRDDAAGEETGNLAAGSGSTAGTPARGRATGSDGPAEDEAGPGREDSVARAPLADGGDPPDSPGESVPTKPPPHRGPTE